MNPEYNSFISDCPIKSPAMDVTVNDARGKPLRTYSVPAGFQLERYVGHLWKQTPHCLRVWWDRDDSLVKAFNVEVSAAAGTLLESHAGVYKTPFVC